MFFGPDKRITLHGAGNFVVTGFFAAHNGAVGLCIHGGAGRHAAKHFAKATNLHGRVAARERDQILDAPADFDVVGSDETDAAGADVPRFLRAADTTAAQPDDFQRQLQLVSLRTPLFH